MQATFSVEIDAPAHLTVLSNSPTAATRWILNSADISVSRVTFQPTPPMSTYLLSMAVGELKAVTGQTSRQVFRTACLCQPWSGVVTLAVHNLSALVGNMRCVAQHMPSVVCSFFSALPAKVACLLLLMGVLSNVRLQWPSCACVDNTRHCLSCCCASPAVSASPAALPELHRPYAVPWPRHQVGPAGSTWQDRRSGKLEASHDGPRKVTSTCS